MNLYFRAVLLSETGFGSKERLMVLNDTKFILMIKGVTPSHLGPIKYHSEPSNVPFSTNQFLALDFFAVSYSKIQVNLCQKLFFLQNIGRTCWAQKLF